MMDKVHKGSSDIHRNQNHKECYNGTSNMLVFMTYNNKQSPITITSKIVYVESKGIKSTAAVLVSPFL